MRRVKEIIIVLICILMTVTVASTTWAAVNSENKTAVKKTAKKTVTIEMSGGTVKKKVSSGSYIVLPADVNGNGYTFLGWSTVRKQNSNPMYQAYEKLRVTGNIHLYPVKYNWNQEPDIHAGNLAGKVEKYDRIIFVGDSRTAMLRSTLQKQCGNSTLDKVGFVCKSGEGLAWMKKEGERLLLEEINRQGSSTKSTAVIFNLGVNDLIHRNGGSISYDSVSSEYASYMNGLSQILKNGNCELFYMSVNPCNTAMKTTRKESEIRGFNNRLKQKLNDNFTWINSYSYLMRCGYTTKCEFRGSTDDGVHYSMRTYKRIYAYVLKKISVS